MEFDCTKDGKNIYFACREKAAKYNDLLNSRERAAELLGISTSTLANHELGVTKNVPPDTVVMMSDLYKTPELRSHYCKHECPIGRNLPYTILDESDKIIWEPEDPKRQVAELKEKLEKATMYAEDANKKIAELQKENEDLKAAIQAQATMGSVVPDAPASRKKATKKTDQEA